MNRINALGLEPSMPNDTPADPLPYPRPKKQGPGRETVAAWKASLPSIAEPTTAEDLPARARLQPAQRHRRGRHRRPQRRGRRQAQEDLHGGVQAAAAGLASLLRSINGQVHAKGAIAELS